MQRYYMLVTGTNNYINVIARSPLLQIILSEMLCISVPKGYKIIPNSVKYHLLYIRADGFYPHWPLFARRISESSDPIELKFSFKQESVRKDVEN